VDWDAAVAALKDAGTVAVACHLHPDGDALGSLFGATVGLRKLGKEAFPTWSDAGSNGASGYRFLPGSDSVVRPAQLPDCDVFLALDCGAPDRLGEVLPKAEAAPVLINVDHHPGNPNFGTHNIVVTTASSTAELVAGLLEDCGLVMDREVATCLYTGIVTDTGRFQYSNTTPDTLRLAADLLAFDVPAPEIAVEVFESTPFGFLKLAGRVLDRAELFAEERFVYSFVSLEDLESHGVRIEETDQLIDLIRSTRDADIAALFKQQPEGNWKVSLRSKAPAMVGWLARARGGGGHELAAGFTTDNIATTVAGMLDDLRKGPS
jgi:bifunctional oligoribonuclease and PAP phosphatase NrnA